MLFRTATFAALAFGLTVSACGKKDDAAAPVKSDAALPNVAAPAGKAWTDMIEETADGGSRVGNPDAPLKLIEYGSLSCPHCAKLSQEAGSQLMDKYVGSGRVSFEFRSFAIHPQDVPLTVLAKCGDKDGFFARVEQVYTNFDDMQKVLEDKAALARAEASAKLPPNQRYVALADALGYTQFFAQRGISVDQANACLGDASKAQAVADLAAKYGNAGIDSTPTLVLNGAKLGVGEWPGLEAALQNAGAR